MSTLSSNRVMDPVISVGADPQPKSPVQIRIGVPITAKHCYSIFEQRQCNLAKWHNGTRECVCNGLSRYAFSSSALLQMGHSASEASEAAADVVIDLKEVLDQHGIGSHGQHSLLEEAMTTTMVVIVAVSSTLLVASLLSAALLVIYCRRVKVLETTSILLHF